MRKKEQLKNQIKKLRSEGFSDYDTYAGEFISYFSHYQYRYAFFFKTIKVLEFAISNENNCEESFLKHFQMNDSGKESFSQDNINNFFQNASILFKSPETIDKILLKFQNSSKFEQYFANVFFPTIFFDFSDKAYQDYAKTFLIRYYNYKHEFNSILNQMTASFILSNFTFRDFLRETFIFKWSNNSEQDTIENVIIDSFFQSLSKLTFQQNEILELYFKNDEKTSIKLIVNLILIPLINLWEFSPYFASNSILFIYEIPKTEEENFQIDNKKCDLIEKLKEIDLEINQSSENGYITTFNRYFSDYLGGYKPSEKNFEINAILNGEPIYIPISKLDEFISEQIKNSDSNESIETVDYHDAFLICNYAEFVYDPKYFEDLTDSKSTFSIEKKYFQFSLQDDQNFIEWKKIQTRAVAMDEDPIKLYKIFVNKDSEKVLEALTFCQEELQHSVDCRIKTVEMMKTLDCFMEEMKKMKIILREIMLKFLFESKKEIKKNSSDEIMNHLLDELIYMTLNLIKCFWTGIKEEEELKQDIINFFKNENDKSNALVEGDDFYRKLDPNYLIELLKRHEYELNNIECKVFAKISSSFFSTLKQYALSKFIVTISTKKSKIVPKGRLSMNQNKVTKYIFPQAKMIVNVGSLQLSGITGYDNYFSGMRLLAFAWLKKSILNQFDQPSYSNNKTRHLDDFHLVEFEPLNSQIRNKTTNNSVSFSQNTININDQSSSESNLKDQSSSGSNLKEQSSSESNLKNQQNDSKQTSLTSQTNTTSNLNEQNDNKQLSLTSQTNTTSNLNEQNDSKQLSLTSQTNTTSNLNEQNDSKQLSLASQTNTTSNLNEQNDEQTIKQTNSINTKSKNVNFNKDVIVTPQANVSFNIPNLALNKSSINQKRRFLDEKNAILWDMVDNKHNKMVTICALIARAHKLGTFIENYSNEFRFWMPQKIIDDIKQLTTEFGIKELKQNV